MQELFMIKDDFLAVQVHHAGAELASIKDAKDDTEYLWQGDARFWNRRAPALFPIVGAVKNKQYLFEGKSYSLPQHGFARDRIFDTEEEKQDRLVFTLREDDASLINYPFHFILKIEYLLNKNRLTVGYRVINADEKTIWFSIGAHPGFNCPFIPGTHTKDYFLEFDSEEEPLLYKGENGIISTGEPVSLEKGKILRLNPDPFQSETIIIKNPRSSSVSMKHPQGGKSITVEYPGFPWLALWKGVPEAPYVCIEPWYGIADFKNASGNLTEKEGVLPLEPGAEFSCKHAIIIDSI
ncbi:aldose 1-epimerase family protein [Candidatus Sumerlaeota bacterium]|nr:aldose 1-epimerase family protein [Candidatus Sumerlaeota bacterium]